MGKQHRVVIIGGGFGGLACAKRLKRDDVSVTLVDRRNYHLFQPLLYQVATGELSPAEIASPLRGILRRQKNCQVLLGSVRSIDLEAQEIRFSDQSVPYDTLVVAAGAGHSYFGHADWEASAPGLKTIEDATEIRKRIFYAFEAAEREPDPEQRDSWLTFAIVGAGPTGVELAGALSEIAHHTLRHDFRVIDPTAARILLIEAGDHPIASFPESLCQQAATALKGLRVEFMSQTRVTQIDSHQVTLESPQGTQQIETRTVIWAAGVAASPLAKEIGEQTGAELDRAGRIKVLPDLTVPNHPNVSIIGDMATLDDEKGHPLPGVAPVAMQQGKFVADNLRKTRRGQEPKGAFKYHDRGSMVVIGRYKAVALVGSKKFSGILAWLFWLVIHLREITQFRSRLVVFFQWGWTFLTRDRSARLITTQLGTTQLGTTQLGTTQLGTTNSGMSAADSSSTVREGESTSVANSEG